MSGEKSEESSPKVTDPEDNTSENFSSNVIDNSINEKTLHSTEECKQIELEDDKVSSVEALGETDVLKQPINNETDVPKQPTNGENDIPELPNSSKTETSVPPNHGESDVVDLCDDSSQEKEPLEKKSITTAEVLCNLETPSDDIILTEPKIQPSLCDITSTDNRQSQNLSNSYDKINPIDPDPKKFNSPILTSNKFKENMVESEISFNNSNVCNSFPKNEMTTQPPLSSAGEKQYGNSIVTNDYCKPQPDPVMLLSNIKQYGCEPLSNEYCKTDTVVHPNLKQYSETPFNDYRKLDMPQQPLINKQMYNKDEFIKNNIAHSVSLNSTQELASSRSMVVEQPKSKVTDKSYSRSVVADNTLSVPKYDTHKHEKQSKRNTPPKTTVPYRMPADVSQVEKQPRLHDYLPPVGFVNYQKMNNPVTMAHSDMPKATKDVYHDKKTESVNMNLPKDKDVMNLPKSIDNSLLYTPVMPQPPYTDQSIMHLSLHHHLAHSSQYHHSAPVPAQVPPPVQQTKSRSKKSEQRRLAQQNQTPVAPSNQQPTPPSSIPGHTQSYHHQSATYMMPQPSPASPYHHSVIQHRMGQQSGSCSSADFYLSHSNQHAAQIAKIAQNAQIASCNLSKLQQMTNGLDHHRRHISSSPVSSPASSPANMTPPPPAASAAAAHLFQQSAAAYHKLYQQAGQTNQSRQYGHQSRGSPATPNVGLMSMQYGAPPSPFNGYRVAPQSTPPPSAAGYMNQTTGQLQYSTHSQDPHHQNGVYPASAYNGSYLQPLNGSMHR